MARTNHLLVRDMNPEESYVHQEYPKWVTLADKTQELVFSADEEAALIAPEPDATSDLM